jgi:uroporphyrinogen decarboxylase
MTMENERNASNLLTVLKRQAVRPAPIWLMRQAGRYLPEYKAARAQAGSFWSMCMSPDLAVEVTLQPIRRFDLDAAILFSDILVVPHALGQAVSFEDGKGPILGPFAGREKLVRDQTIWEARLAPVYEAMTRTRAELVGDKALIGFAGAPWTLAAYMLEGQSSSDQRAAKLAGYRDPQEFSELLTVLADVVAWHLVRQLQSGADVVQIFDSWAGGLPEHYFLEWVVKPNKRVVDGVRKVFPHAPIIGFPRAATQQGYEAYAKATGVNGLSIDTSASMRWAAASLGDKVALQGNLDPIALIAGGETLDTAIDRILSDTAGIPLIFNLGHGVLPETPPDHVARLVSRIRSAA